MFETVKLGLSLLHQAVMEGKWREMFHERIFRNRIVTPVELDLRALEWQKDPLEGTGCVFLELSREDIQTGKLSFAVHERRANALYKLGRGMRGFALVREGIVLGDLWCVAPSDKSKPIRHPDLTMLRLECAEGEAYAQDMLIDPRHRGKNLAVPLQRAFHLALKQEGWKKVYGFYYDDNLPAMWMHRMLKFKELPKLRVSRISRFYLKVEKAA
ncbi:MAG: hypothetical protein N2117_01270 [Anaerolineales bacterium]|nr:hypothetical protein [Anaerolineales bacterium]